jgi:hypothetical protein
MTIRGMLRHAGIATITLLAVIAMHVPSNANSGLVLGLARAKGGAVVTIELTKSAPYRGLATLNGAKMKIECVVARRQIGASYSLLAPVYYDTQVLMRARLPNGKGRWIGIFGFQGVAVGAQIHKTAGPDAGDCGTGIDTWSFPKDTAIGYLVVV